MRAVMTCATLLAYILAVGLVLEYSHRAYWALSSRIAGLRIRTGYSAALASAAACIPLAGAMLVTWVFLLAEGRSLASIGFAVDSGSAPIAVYGTVLGLGCVTVVFLIGLLVGYIHVRDLRPPTKIHAGLPGFLEGLVAFFSCSVFEELVFRGYIFGVLVYGFGPTWAIAVSSVMFASAHLFKHKDVPLLFTLNAVVFGLLAALCRYWTGSLWLPIGLHFGWNAVSGSILGLPFAGRSFDRGVVACEVSGPVWLTGGLHSLDAGLFGTFALAVAAAGLLAVAPVH